MNVFINNTEEKNEEMRKPMLHEHKVPGKHIPPHERAKLLPIRFDEADIALLSTIFGDEDTAEAALMIIETAPPEIRILAIQLINIIEKKEVA